VAAFGAPEEPDLAFISRPELAEPPECKIVLALGALDLDRGHGLDLSFFFNDNDLVFGPFMGTAHLVGLLDLPDIPAFPAFELTSGGD